MVTQGYDKHTQTFYLRSDDPKPSGVENGTRIIEVDTGKDYRFDAENSTWRNIQHGGDTPSPSGDPHFSKITYSTGYKTYKITLYSENGEYEIPSEVTNYGDDAAFEIFLCTPCKTMAHLDRIGTLNLTVYFTPADDFSLPVQTYGDEVTNGDGKLYDMIGDFMMTAYNEDFFASLS